MAPNPEGGPGGNKCSTLDCADEALVVRFSPYEWSTGLLAVGTHSQILIISCSFQDDKAQSAEGGGVQFERVAEFQHFSRVTDLSWSPETSLHSVPRVIKFFSAGADNVVRCIASNLKSAGGTVKTVGSHGDYVNAISVDPECGEGRGRVASVSDDLTCCVWAVSGVEEDEEEEEKGGRRRQQRVACFPLTSPGIAVCWHPNEASKILVAEKKGVIRFYSLLSQQAIMSLDCFPAATPLMAADWCQANSLRVAALSHSDWFVFDTSRSSRALESRAAHTGGGRAIQWCQSHEYLLATSGQPGAQLRVFNLRSNQVVLSLDLKVLHGLCWHSRLPVLALGVDKQVQLWPVPTI